jgi:hypothetical protein
MRMLAATAIAALLLAAPAAAQVNRDLRNNVGNAATVAAPPNALAPPNDTPHILNGNWTRIEPHPGAGLMLQTGADGALTGTYSDEPCTGAYVDERFTLFCKDSARNSFLITGRARLVPLSNSQNSAARVVVQPARIEGRIEYLTTGLRPQGSSEFFNASRN